ncbi:MAG: MAPEG family protein [Gammaproteobacteria bacterium]|nr:MAPEG family protein [Gammaproteobacteria bacterium]
MFKIYFFESDSEFFTSIYGCLSFFQNAIENLVLFAPLVLMLYAPGISTQSTALACAIYFFAHAAHYFM